MNPTPFHGEVPSDFLFSFSGQNPGESHLEARPEDYGTTEFSKKRDATIAAASGIGAGAAIGAAAHPLVTKRVLGNERIGAAIDKSDAKIAASQERQAAAWKKRAGFMAKMKEQGLSKGKMAALKGQATKASNLVDAEVLKSGNPRSKGPNMHGSLQRSADRHLGGLIRRKSLQGAAKIGAAGGAVIGTGVLISRMLRRKNADGPKSLEMTAIEPALVELAKWKKGTIDLKPDGTPRTEIMVRKPRFFRDRLQRQGRIVGLSPLGKATAGLALPAMIVGSLGASDLHHRMKERKAAKANADGPKSLEMSSIEPAITELGRIKDALGVTKRLFTRIRGGEKAVTKAKKFGFMDALKERVADRHRSAVNAGKAAGRVAYVKKMVGANSPVTLRKRDLVAGGLGVGGLAALLASRRNRN